MRFVYVPETVPEWIHLFNEVAETNGLPDERDPFHPIKDLKFCIESMYCLYHTLEVLNEYKVTMSLKVVTKKVTTCQEFYDGYELDQTDFVAQYLEPMVKEAEATDILSREQVMKMRRTLKAAMEKMVEAVPILIGKELRLTTEEDNNRKYESDT